MPPAPKSRNISNTHLSKRYNSIPAEDWNLYKDLFIEVLSTNQDKEDDLHVMLHPSKIKNTYVQFTSQVLKAVLYETDDHIVYMENNKGSLTLRYTSVSNKEEINKIVYNIHHKIRLLLSCINEEEKNLLRWYN